MQEKHLVILKQMGVLNSISSYNAEFSKWLLQVQTMAGDEQIFHYSQGLKNKIRVEIERSEVTSPQEAMRIADRMDKHILKFNFFLFKEVQLMEQLRWKLELYLININM